MNAAITRVISLYTTAITDARKWRDEPSLDPRLNLSSRKSITMNYKSGSSNVIIEFEQWPEEYHPTGS